MSFLKRLSYSLSGAIVISALSFFSYPIGGELAAVPGIIMEGLVNVAIVEITNDTFAGFVNRWMYFNIVFYTSVIYLVSFAVHAIRKERKRAKDGSVTPPRPQRF